MKAQKVDDVTFQIENNQANMKFDILRKEGGLFLSLSNLFFKSDEKWYEIPLEKLEKIKVIQREPPKLEFSIPSMKITVSGGFAEKLLALRHLLLPYIKEENSVKEPILGVLKLWGLNIKDTKAISDLLDIDSSKVEDLLKEAKENELIKDNQLTKKGKKLLDEDGDLLEKLEV
ncbi:MAG: hypothetical protein R6W73_02435 [Candidatus Saliniplasma sp.]